MKKKDLGTLDTWDAIGTLATEELKAVTTAETVRLRRKTVKIPTNREEVTEMDEYNFANYVDQCIESARQLVHQVLVRCKESQAFIIEWDSKYAIEAGSLELNKIHQHILDRIKSIEALQVLCSSEDKAGDFKVAKQILEEVKTKINHRKGY